MGASSDRAPHILVFDTSFSGLRSDGLTLPKSTLPVSVEAIRRNVEDHPSTAIFWASRKHQPSQLLERSPKRAFSAVMTDALADTSTGNDRRSVSLKGVRKSVRRALDALPLDQWTWTEVADQGPLPIGPGIVWGPEGCQCQ